MESTKPKEEPTANTPPIEEGGEQTSKKAAKKAEAKAKKEAEKARKAAEREAAAAQQGGASGGGEDLAKDNYGVLPKTGIRLDAERIELEKLTEEHVGKKVQIRAWIQNARQQGAKMAFVELRKRGDWTIQGVVSASAEGTPVSRPMVKWIGALRLESLVLIEAVVQKPLEPVKSTKVSGLELHLTKVYLVAAAPENLGMTLATASVAVGGVDEDEEATEGVEGWFKSSADLRGLLC